MTSRAEWPCALREVAPWARSVSRTLLAARETLLRGGVLEGDELRALSDELLQVEHMARGLREGCIARARLLGGV